ncbi:trans-sulfuration enzyme family protein [Liquorilactobacillus satsumensis]|uniref:Cystathionine beta-lyase n=1 Tax=Liquorilactobacillus satsumensis DSM 16230 = JCM 12392 TaxID=1423801 RepID=A0A0R1UVG3_9LACO|nr:PLP-dependent aspartate aminotransferase family protein [Liquorilactobacillus satsumensis]KRL97183.1 cystathionine beta-lyase [Liquorilactobacillus satsumensis DSM 16230 = JCM 12392]MCC7666834.1 PLP-dependent transferase [Liquorilactobacillus satsumensis]MCP9311915.1 PLP-dependent transferase [Liquorilactobacillus satsumensis]MCP9328607.1 PLP-dependent transferase [Liquorilactobacillus satsumensis]MCP9356934.1 PLP-dependent transferase [Liquorilactobacillus satsumensis]
MRTNTKLLHGYTVVDSYTGASSVPKYQTSTFKQNELYGETQKYSYTRFGNPTVAALEEGFCTIEDSKYALAYSSGMAAISNVLMLLNAGDHVILPLEVYGGTCQFASEILPKYQIETSFVDMADLAKVEAAIKPNTRLLYLETPSNPLLKVCDIAKIVDLTRNKQILTVADNTFMTALEQQPLALGVDLVLESVTKFINGHSDVVAGLVATNQPELASQLRLLQKNFGAILGIEEAWLVLRGMKTMGLRMEKSVQNAQVLAEFLQNNPKIKHVYYPGLKNHPLADVQRQQAKSGGAVLSFEVYDKATLLKLTQKINLPILAVSLGGVESILSHPATMSHACLTPEERRKQGVTDELLRLSCGIEDTADLLADFKQALL